MPAKYPLDRIQLIGPARAPQGTLAPGWSSGLCTENSSTLLPYFFASMAIQCTGGQ